MRVGIIRGDMPGPVFMADLEPTSQTNFPTDPAGQSRYVSRPDVTNVTNVMNANVGAGFSSVGNLTTPITINGGNQTLRAKIASAASYSVILIPTGVYSTLAALVAAANPVLAPLGMALEINPVNTARLVLYSLTFGPGSFISIDTTGNGSTFNGATAANFGAGGGSFTVPSVSTLITATLPVGGPLDVRATTLRTQLGPALTDAQVSAVAGSIAPQFVETEVAIRSFGVGDLHELLSPVYTPDPTRLPALTLGPAITVVQDDGNTLFTAPLPIITGAVHNTPNPGDLTISGSGMAVAEPYGTLGTTIRITNPTTGAFVRVTQKIIQATLSGGTQGSVSPTSIVIPASLIGGSTGFGSVTGNQVELQFGSLANTDYGTAASLTTVTNGVATLTGLANMNSSMVGNKITLSGCASAANNGTFFIVAVLSATSATISNVAANASDGNNGAIVWSVPPPVAFITT